MAKKQAKQQEYLVSRRERLDIMYSSYSRDEFVKKLDESILKIPEAYRHTVRFEIDTYSYPYDEKDYQDLFMNYQTPENEAEKSERLEKEAALAAKKAREQKEKKEFEEFKNWKAQQEQNN